jgi:2-methylcitrate dehydratase PrpD
MGERVDPDRLDADLGSHWALFDSGLKPYPCGIVTHPAIDAALEIHHTSHPDPADIVGIEVRVHPLVLELTNKQSPATGLEGKFSVAVTIATALCRGRLLPADFAPETLDQPDIARLRPLVQLTSDPDSTQGQAHAVVHLRSGRSLTADVDVATGMPGRPMGEAALREKFHGLVDPVLGVAAATRVADLVDVLAEAPDLAALVTATVRLDEPVPAERPVR